MKTSVPYLLKSRSLYKPLGVPAEGLRLSDLALQMRCAGAALFGGAGSSQIRLIGGAAGQQMLLTNWGAGISGGTSIVGTEEGLAARFSGNGTSNGTYLNADLGKSATGLSQSFSIVARVRPASFAVNANLDVVHIGKSTIAGGISIGFDTSNRAVATWYTDGSGPNSTSPGGAYTNSYVTLGASGGGNKNALLYENGVLTQTGAAGAGTDATPDPVQLLVGRGSRNVTVDVSWVFAFRRPLSDAEHWLIATNPWALLEPVHSGILGKPAGGGARTLTAAGGSFSFTGQAAGLLRGRVLGAANGTYSLAGQAANLTRGRTLVAAGGSFSLAGQAATLRRTYALAAAGGGYTLSGQAANLLFGHRLIAAVGTFSLAGQAANLVRGRVLAGGFGTFSFAGQAAGLLRGRNLQAAVGTYLLAGQAVTLTKTGAKTLTAAVGSFALQGQTVNLLRGRRLIAAQGAYSLAGQPAALTRGRTLTAARGTYSLAGQAVSFGRTYRLTAVGGTYLSDGQVVTLSFSGSGGGFIIDTEDRWTAPIGSTIWIAPVDQVVWSSESEARAWTA